MTRGPALRAAARADVPAIVEIVNEAFDHERWLLPGPRLRGEDAERELLAPGVSTIVATVKHELVGVVRVRFETERGESLAIPELGLLAVRAAAQGRGIGARLVHAAEEVARRANRDAIELRCGRELGLEAYYESLGYQRVAEQLGLHFGSYRPFTLVTLERRWATATSAPAGS